MFFSSLSAYLNYYNENKPCIFSAECQLAATQTAMGLQPPRDLTLRTPSLSSMTHYSRRSGIRPGKSDALGESWVERYNKQQKKKMNTKYIGCPNFSLCAVYLCIVPSLCPMCNVWGWGRMKVSWWCNLFGWPSPGLGQKFSDAILGLVMDHQTLPHKAWNGWWGL